MLYPVNWIRVKIIGSAENLNSFLDYRWNWYYSYLRNGNTFPEIRLEDGAEMINLLICCTSSYSISLCIFDILVNKFHRLNFILHARNDELYRRYPYDKHVLYYQNGEKISHLHEYSKTLNKDENGYEIIIYRADHLNKTQQILEKIIHDGDGVYDKSFQIVYENYYVAYIEEEKQNPKIDANVYKIWF